MSDTAGLRTAAEVAAANAQELARDLARKIAKGQPQHQITAARKRHETAVDEASRALTAWLAVAPQHPTKQQAPAAVGAFNAAIRIEEN